VSAPDEARGVVPPPGRAASAADIPSAGFIVAALYVEKGGAYYDLAGVDPWDVERDARTYAGPYPVVAHPPCTAWCKLAGLVEARWGHKRGDDGGCFTAALAAVREWGGVLEHPANSHAWRAFGLLAPAATGWSIADWCGGWACEVEQGNYGHPARKKTWLYVNGAVTPALRWGRATPSATVSWCRNRWTGHLRRIGKAEAARTPTAFRDVLLGIARSARPEFRNAA